MSENIESIFRITQMEKKVAVVTGGASGIRKCIAEEFRTGGILI